MDCGQITDSRWSSHREKVNTTLRGKWNGVRKKGEKKKNKKA